MGTATTRTIEDRAAGILRMIRALSRELTEWDTDHLVVLSTMEVAIEEVREQVVYGMREHGVTDTQIAQALGVTQQAVSKRWPGGGRFVGAAGRYRKPKENQ